MLTEHLHIEYDLCNPIYLLDVIEPFKNHLNDHMKFPEGGEFKNCKISQWPAQTEIVNDARFIDCEVSIPAHLKLSKSNYFGGCLINKFDIDGVEGSITFSHCRGKGINPIGDKLKATNLEIFSCTFKELPETLELRGSLDIMDSLITRIPKNAKIAGDLIFSNDSHDYYDSYDYNYQSNCQTFKHPVRNLNFPDLITVEKCQIGGSIMVEDQMGMTGLTTKIKLDDGIEMGGNFIFDFDHFIDFPNLITAKNITLLFYPWGDSEFMQDYLDGQKNISIIPDRATINGNLIMELNSLDAKVKILGNDVTVNGHADFRSMSFQIDENIPPQLTINGDLFLDADDLPTVPIGWSVTGDIIYVHDNRETEERLIVHFDRGPI